MKNLFNPIFQRALVLGCAILSIWSATLPSHATLIESCTEAADSSNKRKEIEYGTASLSVMGKSFHPVRSGDSSFRSVIFKSDKRSEFRMAQTAIGGTYWYGWSIYIPSNWNTTNAEQETLHNVLLAQWATFPSANNNLGQSRDGRYDCRGNGSHLKIGNSDEGNFANTESSNLLFRLQYFGGSSAADDIICNKYTLASVDSIKGRWVDFVMHVKWTGNTTSAGFLKLWMKTNGVDSDYQQKINYSGPTFWDNEGTGPYFKMGAYTGIPQWRGPDSRTLYTDEYRLGDSGSSMAEVAPPGAPIKSTIGTKSVASGSFASLALLRPKAAALASFSGTAPYFQSLSAVTSGCGNCGVSEPDPLQAASAQNALDEPVSPSRSLRLSLMAVLGIAGLCIGMIGKNRSQFQHGAGAFAHNVSSNNGRCPSASLSQPFMKSSFFLITLFLSLICSTSHAQSVAVFDPQSPPFSSRFIIDPARLDQTAQILQKAGFAVERVSAEQLIDPAQFSAEKFAVFVSRGDSVPRGAIPNLKTFVADGGSLVALAASRPYVIATAKKADGTWTYSPERPHFAWETREITDAIGLRYLYKPALHDSGTLHTPSALWKKYRPDAQNVSGKRESLWLVPWEDGKIYPLLGSKRGDGADVTPQIFAVKGAGGAAVVSVSPRYSEGEDAGENARNIVALVRLATDLQSGAQKLDEIQFLSLRLDLPALMPLSTRQVTGNGVEPEGAKPLARWGRFDGSGQDLGESTLLPRVLEAGKSVKLPVPANATSQTWLRVRGAFATTGAGLRVEREGQTLWNETFSLLDTAGAGNFFAADLGGLPCEFNRLVFMLPGNGSFTLSNPGNQPLYFDAAQLETRPLGAPNWIVGLNAGFNQSRFRGPYQLPLAEMKKWNSVRTGIWGSSISAPGELDRWKNLQERMERFRGIPSKLELIFEGTAEWSAISPERYKAASANKRFHTAAPNPEKWGEIAEYVTKNYGDFIDKYEIWNEANSPQFFQGTPLEYVAFWKRIVPIVKKNDPTALIISSGMAGWDNEFVDELIANGILKEADLFGFHPYASKSPAWDVPFGQAQGELYARGQNIEIYNNEIGFTYMPGEWFVGDFNETTQARLTDVALSRLLASGSAKVSLFHAGGDDHLYSLIRPNGTPRPAYRVVEDYLPLGENGGRRLDVAMSRRDGNPLSGIYVAAASFADGGAHLVINPSETALAATLVATVEKTAPNALEESFDERGAWRPFYGEAKFADGQVHLITTPGQAYVGLRGQDFEVDLNTVETLEIVVPTVGQRLEISFVTPDGKQIATTKITQAGIGRIDLREKLAGLMGRQRIGVVLRAFGDAKIDALRFLPTDSTETTQPVAIKPATQSAIPLQIWVPLSSNSLMRASATVAGKSAPVTLETQTRGGMRWAKISLDLSSRTIVTLGK